MRERERKREREREREREKKKREKEIKREGERERDFIVASSTERRVNTGLYRDRWLSCYVDPLNSIRCWTISILVSLLLKLSTYI